ncbi:MAG: DUF4876 domain-containing protein [Bacteroidetes bacterium]|nr:DUF4876 domain-containing protein [Bacteroidota bacterium]
MKFSQYFFYTAMLIVLAVAGCKKRDLTPDVGSLNIKINVSYDTIRGNFNLPVNGIKLKLSNQWNSKENTTLSDNGGMAEFKNVSAGIYDIVATVTIPKDLFNSLTGQSVEEDVTLNSSLNKMNINNTLDSVIKLKMEVGRIGGLVLKQIYYAGSNTSRGASFRDQFIEIYNNSNEIIFADSLYIAQVIGCNTVSPNLTTGFFITSGPMVGQWDWSKSIGMPSNINANNDYIYAKSLYRIPGNGTQYPILPGESIILAQTAVNHKAPYSNSTGGTIEIKDPSLTIDLSNADFEVYLAPYLATPLASDVDNPAVPNLIMLDYTGKDWLFDNPGRDGFAIFRTDIDIPTTFKKYPDPTVAAITSSTTTYYQIPADLVLDAVEIQPNTATSRVPKRLLGRLDAGYNYVPAGSYSSQSLIRKTVKTVSGRRILMDTNNSTNDFDYLNMVAPKAFK